MTTSNSNADLAENGTRASNVVGWAGSSNSLDRIAQDSNRPVLVVPDAAREAQAVGFAAVGGVTAGEVPSPKAPGGGSLTGRALLIRGVVVWASGSAVVVTNRAADDSIEVAERVLISTTQLVDRVAPPGIIADMNESTLSAVDAVRSYVVALREVRSRLFADLPGMTGVQDFMFAVRSQRTMAREGRTDSGIEYSVHGVGCRMTDEDGREVDVDLIPAPDTTMGVEAFDAWRIKLFLSNSGYHPPTNEELNAACEQLAACGELRVVEQGRWFALPPSS